MKKVFVLISILLIIASFLYLITILNKAYLPTLIGGYFKVPFYYHILFFIGAYFGVVLLHELAHAVAFLIKGIKPKMILVLFFLFHKTDKWHMVIDPKLIILGGGMVMPDFHKLEDEQTIIKYQQATSFSLIVAPTFTIVLASILLLSNWIFFYNIPWFTVVTTYVFLMSAFFTYTSTLSAAGIYGDFVAYKKVISEPIFGLSVVSQFVGDITPFHFQTVRARLFESRPSDFSIHLLNFYALLLEKGIYEDSDIDEKLLEKTKILATTPHIIRRISRQFKQVLIIQQAILYLYRCGEDDLVDKLLNFFIVEIDHMKAKDSVKLYYKKLTNHLLDRIDETDFLMNHTDFSLGLMDLIVSHLPEYQQAENDRLKPIQRFEKKPLINLDNQDTL